MSQKIQVVLIDDIDGGEADETLSFALDGVSYEIDVSEDNAQALRDALSTWVGHARRVAGRASGKAKSGSARGKSAASARLDLADVRSWARANGFQVSERGRVSAEVLTAYEGAH